MAADVHLFGVRHHGPGSARRLEEALEALAPALVLIEGPADASDLLPLLADPAMVPPVALLAYAEDAPERAVFWPFASFSPEYRAVVWAVGRGVPVRFIDLPVAWRLADDAAPPPAAAAATATGPAPDHTSPAEPAVAAPPPDPVRGDPIGTLARLAGYEDGESWWRDVIEENPAPGPVFAAVADAIAALREGETPPEPFEAQREAHMRLAIAEASTSVDGPVAVVCGAWHVPALAAKQSRKDDRALLRNAPRRRIAATWAPWTSPRLTFTSGYGAGVAAPGWCRHVFETSPAETATRWLARIAAALRSQGHHVSTASLIEAERLGRALAALRGRPAPGFEELREAAVACLCEGERLVFETVAHPLLVGTEVGAIPDGVPLAPLLEDLQRQQKTARLKPEALERELSLDLRTEAGLFRSTLLHRLSVLDVPWGRLADAGRSRGTFRERWLVAWEPEFAVRLVESLVWGSTLEQAATARLQAELAAAADLGTLAAMVRAAMTAQLGAAATTGIALLERRAAQTSDCRELLAALPPMADLLRYGEARATDLAQTQALMRRIALEGALALPYAARNLDAEAAASLRQAVAAAHAAIRLAAFSGDDLEHWLASLAALVDDDRASRLAAGLAARLLYEAERISSGAVVVLLGRMLSPGATAADAAAFFEGFFEGAGQRLLHDAGLRDAVDRWMSGLEEEAFIAYLPLFRRVFADLDRTERRRLLDTLLGRQARTLAGLAPAPDATEAWARHFAIVSAILTREPADG